MSGLSYFTALFFSRPSLFWCSLTLLVFSETASPGSLFSSRTHARAHAFRCEMMDWRGSVCHPVSESVCSRSVRRLSGGAELSPGLIFGFVLFALCLLYCHGGDADSSGEPLQNRTEMRGCFLYCMKWCNCKKKALMSETILAKNISYLEIIGRILQGYFTGLFV